MSNDDYKFGVPQEDLSNIVLSEGQKGALKALSDWLKSPTRKQYFVLAGGAGTGKSTMLNYIVDTLGYLTNRTMFCTLTGKASLVLRRKGIKSNTIHSQIYSVATNIINGREIVKFSRVKRINYDLIIVDEASMITREMFNDLLSFGKPVVFVGDSFQLPPIGDEFNIMSKPDYLIQDILRQCLDSPILQLAYMAKEGKYIPTGKYGEGVECVFKKDISDDDIVGAGQIIVGRNDTRTRLNNMCREKLGYSGNPRRDEKLVVLSNNPYLNAFNGQIIYLTTNARAFKKKLKADFIDEYEYNDSYFAITATPRSAVLRLTAKRPDFSDILSSRRDDLFVDYGYAVTCHKVQGSQFDDVLIYGKFGFDNETRNRWLYTAITRAVNSLKIVNL